jgi:hypothetical protein
MRLWRWLGAEPVALGAGEMTIRRPLSAATLLAASPGLRDGQKQLHEQAGQPEHRIDAKPTDDHEHGPQEGNGQEVLHCARPRLKT